MIKTIENNLAELIIIGIFIVAFFSSCGIQMGDYDRWRELNENKSICESVDELRYYVQEDVWNGNLDSTVAVFYIKELDNICERIEMDCENCDEID
jgi:hypothetical protein